MSTIEKLESILQSQKNNFEFAKKTNNSQRKRNCKQLVRETEAKIKELEREHPIETNALLTELIGKLTLDIKTLEENLDIIKKEFNEKREKLEKALNPLKSEPEQETKPEPEQEPEQETKTEPKPLEVKAEQVKMLECDNCGRMFKGEKGMTIHQRTCKGDKL